MRISDWSSDVCSSDLRSEIGSVLASWFEAPDISGKRACFAHQFLGAAGIVDGGFDLAAMAHDAGILEQPLDIGFGESRDLAELETGKGGAEIVTLGEDRAPRQAGLEAFERSEEPTSELQSL